MKVYHKDYAGEVLACLACLAYGEHSFSAP